MVVGKLTKNRIRGLHRLHLDPDLSEGMLPRMEGWRPAFGQEKAAASHLRGQGVGPGDLFMFFGWFREVDGTPSSGELSYVRGAADKHVLFGWLQVGEVIEVGAALEEHRELHPMFADHPHMIAHGAPGNVIYVASERLVIDGIDMGVPGGGAFDRYHDGLRLTRNGMSRTNWELPGWFHPDNGVSLTYHGDPARWAEESDGSCTLKSVAKGQEFVMDISEVPECREWVAGLLDGAVEMKQAS